MLNRKIQDLVAENYEYAEILYDFGIHFYHYSELTLAQACKHKGLNYQQVIQGLESIHHTTPTHTWQEYSVDIVIHYLKHTHTLFLKDKLPYMADLIADLKAEQYQDKNLIKDLQLLFPLFAEDFIHHIHEEEDTLFQYIHTLHNASLGRYKFSELYYQMEKYSIQYFALDHHTHDDEMRGIRKITNNYTLPPQSELHLKVIFEELKALERELQIHAQIEDEILFIKALQLEKKVKEMIKQKSGLN
jgi:regulator of cell morphogenesis and NO signaling